MNITKHFPVYVEQGTSLNNLLEIQETYEMEPDMFNSFTDDLHIIQVGAGGTGGYVAAEILRFMGGLPASLQDHVFYTLIDGDKFEPKNLSRQLCTTDDLGEYKSVSIVNNYGAAFGCRPDRVQAIPGFLTDWKQLTGLALGEFPGRPHIGASMSLFHRNSNLVFPENRITSAHGAYYVKSGKSIFRVHTIVIDCVDKNTPRKLIADSITDWATGSFADDPRTSRTALLGRCGILAKEKTTIPKITKYNSITDTQGNSYVLRRSGAPAVYVISTGNDKYTGQVYWGRYSSLLEQVPVMYQDLYGNHDASPLFDPEWTGEEAYIRDVNATLGDVELQYMSLLMAQSNYSYEWEYLYSKRPMRFVKRADLTAEPEVIPDKNDFVNMAAFSSRYISVPLPYYIFPELTDIEADKREEAMSCADRAAINVQNINVNRTAAQFVVNYFCSIFRGIFPIENEPPIPMSTVGVRFDVRTNSVTPEYLTTDYLRRCHNEMLGIRSDDSQELAEEA